MMIAFGVLVLVVVWQTCRGGCVPRLGHGGGQTKRRAGLGAFSCAALGLGVGFAGLLRQGFSTEMRSPAILHGCVAKSVMYGCESE